ncbi:NrsF family protein [Phenylobacterium sp.]|uniref:NrsF family protein n=1 Tax=Phenylobacterium sp. TaxID=1871053 RepID=UPI002F4104D0
MRTPELIELLAADTRSVSPAAAPRRLALAALAGAGVALALVIVWLQPRPDLARAASGGFFWIKAAYTAALATAGFLATERLGRPGVSARSAALMALAVLALFETMAILQFAPMTDAARLGAIQGVSWTVCSRHIVMVAAPMTLICLLVLRRLAPTRPMAAGFAAGAFSGAVGATVYGLHCPEATFVFVGLWYTLGVLVSGLIGAVLGRFMLRW